MRSILVLAVVIVPLTWLMPGCGGAAVGTAGGGETTGSQDADAAVACVGPPTVEIQLPKDGQRFDVGDLVGFKGKAVPTDGNYEAMVVEWSSDMAGVLCSAKGEAGGATYCESASLSAGNHEVTLKATDACGLDSADTVLVIVNGAPETPEVAIEPAQPTTQDNLKAVTLTEPVDPNGDPVTMTYVWLKDGEVQAGISGSTVGQGLTTRGEEWTVKVTASDGSLAGQTRSASVVIGNDIPAADSVQILPSSGGTTTVFECVPAGWTDADGDEEGYQFAWYVNGDLVTGEAGSSITGLTKGDEVVCEATPYDGQDSGEKLTSAPALVVNSSAACGSATLTPEAGDVTTTFQCDAFDCVDADGDAFDVGTIWVVDGQELPGTNSQTLNAKDFGAKKGSTLQCKAVASDPEGEGSPTPSNVVTLANAPGQVTSAVVVPDTAPPVEGSVLDCVAGGWSDPDGDPEGYQYGWVVNGGQVEGATDSALTGEHFEKGDVVECIVYPDDGSGPGAGVPSKNAVLIVDTAPSLASAVVVPDTGSKADVYDCQFAGWADPDTADFQENWPTPDPMDVSPPGVLVQWTVDGQDAAGASGAMWQPLTAKKGQKIACRATPFDGELEGVPATSLDVMLLNAAPWVDGASVQPPVGGKLSQFTCVPGPYTDLDAGDPQSFLFSWSVNGVALAGQELSELSGFDAKLKTGDEVVCTVTPYDGQDFGQPAVSTAAKVANQPPSLASVVVAPASPTVADDLTCTPQGYSDADGDPEGYKYAWTVNSALLPSQKGAVLPKGTAKKGQSVVCQVIPFDGTSEGFVVASAPVVVVNSVPTAPVTHIEPEMAKKGDDLECVLDQESQDADGDPVTYTWSWLVDGAPVPGEVDPLLAGSAAKQCSLVACEVRGSDGTAQSAAALAEAVVDGTPGLFVDSAASAAVVPDAASLKLPAQKLTVEAWVRPTGNAGSLVTKRKLGMAATDRGFALALLPDGTAAFVVDTGATDGTLLVSGAPVPVGKFSHVAGVYDGASARLFVNGVLEDAASVTGPIDSTVPLTVGIAPDTGAAVKAVVDEVRVSEEALYAANFFPGMVLSASASTRLLLHLDEGAGNLLADASASNNKGSCTACVWKQGMCNLQTQNLPPTAPVVAITPTKPVPTDDLVCKVTQASVDPEGKPVTYEYKWTSTTGKTGNAATLPNASTEAGEAWTCTVTPSDGVNKGPAGSASVTIEQGGFVPSGTYTLAPPVSFTCAWGMVNLSLSMFTFKDNGATLTVEPLMNGGCYMTGPSAKSGTINVTCLYAGTCNETYTLTGTFNGANWSGTLTAKYQGMCLGCTNQSWPMTGTKL